MLVGYNSSPQFSCEISSTASVVLFDGVASLMQHFKCAAQVSAQTRLNVGNRGSAAELISLFPFLSVRAELKL
jgi:hypothetical protein